MSDAHGARYEQAGVDYETLDRAKRFALDAAAATFVEPSRGASMLGDSLGEPASVIEISGRYFAFVLECLGTKSMIARAYEDETGNDLFSAIGYDTVASVVNDCCCVGALPVVVNAYFATGSASWYGGSRAESLVLGWRNGCADAGAAWGGGESPTLSGLVAADEIDLAGAAMGLIPVGRRPLFGEQLLSGDEIVLVSSSGLHANGASLVRSLAKRLPKGLSSPLLSGRALGEAVLDPSVIYVALMQSITDQDLELHYASHLTGHGWRKLMRARQAFTYRITDLPAVPEVLSFVVDELAMSAREAYGTFNMGAGFALYVPSGSGTAIAGLANDLGYSALVAGRVEEGPRQVLVEPLQLTYSSEELELR